MFEYLNVFDFALLALTGATYAWLFGKAVTVREIQFVGIYCLYCAVQDFLLFGLAALAPLMTYAIAYWYLEMIKLVALSLVALGVERLALGRNSWPLCAQSGFVIALSLWHWRVIDWRSVEMRAYETSCLWAIFGAMAASAVLLAMQKLTVAKQFRGLAYALCVAPAGMGLADLAQRFGYRPLAWEIAGLATVAALSIALKDRRFAPEARPPAAA